MGYKKDYSSKSQSNFNQEDSFLSKNYLLKLCIKSENEIIDELMKLTNLEKKIQNTKFNDDTFTTIVQIFAKIAKINSGPCKMILNFVLNTELFDLIGKQIKSEAFFLKIYKETNEERKEETLQYLNDLITVCEECTFKFVEKLSSLPINEIQKLIERINKFPILEDFYQLATVRSSHLTSSVEKIQFKQFEMYIQKEKQEETKKKEEYANIPISYKEESIYLTKEEIFKNNNQFIQKHRKNGDYESWDRYLNTMFYLVREDCYRLLRQSINAILNQPEIEGNIDKMYRDIYYYKSVKIKDLQIDIKGIVFTLEFETFQKKISWSKRLLFGSLVIITKDDFGDIVLAMVNEGPDPQKSKGPFYRCKVTLIDNDYQSFSKFIEWSNNDDKVHMFESKAYFESYRHILKRIQDIDTRSLPFTDVLINYRKPLTTDILLPAHYNSRTTMEYNSKSFYLYKNEWPSELTEKMDLSQLNALKHGLRNKVSIIQGPPGTGKTYVGSILTKILLNKTNTPILVVCFTNHALDQFLRHISHYEKKIVRVGGRCKDEALQEFTLNNIKKNNKCADKQYWSVRKSIKAAAEKLKRFTDSFSTSTFLDFKTCYYNYQVFCDRLIKNFMNYLNADFKFDYKNIKNLNNEDIYTAWINPKKMEVIAKKIIFKSKKEYFVFLGKFDKLQMKNDNVNTIKNLENKANDKDESYDVSFEDEENQIENMNRKELDNEINDDMNLIDEDEDDTVQLSKGIQELLLEDNTDDYLNGIKSKDIEALINSDCNLWNLSIKTRRGIMMFIKRVYVLDNLSYIQPDIEKFNQLIKQKKELDDLADLKYLQCSKIVGMTTSGCARYSTFLEQISFETVIVEEAAEVLESHISSILTRHTKQLVLIGDHQQLRPNPFNYEICKKYDFDVSLFERLINNTVPYVSLQYQRRMRPEFADFVRLIYKTSYSDHESTRGKSNNKGFTSNIHFLNHKEFEDVNAGLASKSNPYEAKFIAALAQYIKLQGNKQESITILTMYIAQVLLIRDELKKLNMDTQLVKVVSVDNYQGEENDFILLSLVRSNKINEIGFLKSFNRVCVAFSRAVLGFYVLGNFDCLVEGQDKNKDNKQQLWTDIYKLAVSKGVMKDSFEFKCQKHKKSTIVKKAEDFKLIPEGGCKELCKERMECGHVCEYFCHNFAHERFHCKKNCERVLTCGHKCVRRCDIDCGMCKSKVEKRLPCGHTKIIECSIDPLKEFCNKEVKFLLDCGHYGIKMCSENLKNYTCKEEIEIKLTACGHSQKRECNIPNENVVCKTPCNEILDCEHICKGNCGDCLNGTLHIPCRNLCNKVLICSHECKKECSQPCLCDKNCENICIHGLCGLGCNEECYPCNEKCQLSCPHSKCTKLCNEMCNFNCNLGCEKVLKCGHKCMGLCGEDCPQICRTCKPDDEIFEIFFGTEDEPEALFYKIDCGHVFEISGLDKHMGLGSDEYSIKSKTCLKCFKPIVKGIRYANIVKKTFNLIQKIKKNLLRQYGDYNEMFQKTQQIISEVKAEYNLDNSNELKKYAVCILFANISNLEKKQYIAELVSAYNLCCFAKEMFQIEKFVEIGTKTDKFAMNDKKVFLEHFRKIREYFLQIKCYSQKFLENLKRKVTTLYLASVVFSSEKFSPYIGHFSMTKYMLSQKKIDSFNKLIPSLKQAEMMEIMNTITGVTWYHCPNGHLYSVGECGQPMQGSNCPDCNQIIGGESHQPHANNTRFVGFNDR